MLFHALPFLLLLLVTAGCTHYNYSPNLVPTPFITQKNESILSANFGGIPGTNNIDLQAAYNPLKSFTLMANFCRASSTLEESNLFVSYDLRYMEGAAGAWAPFNDKRFHAGFIVGGGTGWVNNNFGGRNYADLRFNKAFLQPTLTFKGRFRLGVAARFVYLGYQQGQIDLAIPERDLSALMLIEDHSPFLLLETGINFGVNLKAVTWTVSVVRTGVSSNTDHNTYQFDPSNISTGLTVDVQRLLKRKK